MGPWIHTTELPELHGPDLKMIIPAAVGQVAADQAATCWGRGTQAVVGHAAEGQLTAVLHCFHSPACCQGSFSQGLQISQ